MSDRGSGRKLSFVLSGLIAAALLSYAALRAAKLSFTFDEAATYISYLSSGLFNALDFTDANNHVLYTLLARLFSAIGGSSELVLRLPSLFGFALYLLFSWALLSRFFGGLAALAGFLIVNLNPFVLDFFSVGRGYGLALGFEMAALYFFLVFLDRQRQSRGGTACRLGGGPLGGSRRRPRQPLLPRCFFESLGSQPPLLFDQEPDSAETSVPGLPAR